MLEHRCVSVSANVDLMLVKCFIIFLISRKPIQEALERSPVHMINAAAASTLADCAQYRGCTRTSWYNRADKIND